MTWMHLSANENRVLVSHDLTETTEWQNRTYLCQKECSVGTNTLCLVHLRGILMNTNIIAGESNLLNAQHRS